MNDPISDPRTVRFLIPLLNSALVLPPALLYSVKTDSPVYLLTTAAILLFAFCRKEYLPVRDRPVIYSITAALILTIIPDLVIVIDDSRHGIFDLLIRSNLMIPLAAYLAAFSCAFYPDPQRRGITAACVITAMVLCGDRFNSAHLSNQVLFFFNPLLRHYSMTYGLAAGWTALALPLNFLFPGTVVGPDRKSLSRYLRPFLLTGCLILLPLCALAAEKYYYGNDALMRAVEYHILRISMRKYAARFHPRRQSLSVSADLNRPPPPDWRNQRTVLLRVRADTPPGRLRGNVYDLYRHGRWEHSRNATDVIRLPATRRTGLVSYSTFSIPDRKPHPSGKIELYFAALQSDGRIPIPGNPAAVHAVADSGEITHSGLLRLKQWKADGACTLLLTAAKPENAWQEPDPPGKNADCLTVPEELRTQLHGILSGLPSVPGSGDAGILQQLRNYFEGFSYTLDPVNSGGNRDPLLRFLLDSRAGHCEFFASAAVLLLRCAGIPARYVTGFVCEEKNPVSDYYLVRSSHAHAWCEAYLRDSRKWVTVDLTPGSLQTAFRTPPSGSGFAGRMDTVKHLFQRIFADIRRGHFAQAVMNLLSGIRDLLRQVFATLPGMLALIALLLWRTTRFLRKRKLQTGTRRHTELAAARRKSADEFARFERRYAAATGARRPDSMALLEFYRDPELHEFCRIYERLRYGAEEPSAEDLRDFTARTAQVLSSVTRQPVPRRE